MNEILSQLIIKNVLSFNTMFAHEKSNQFVKKDRACWGLFINYEGEVIFKNHSGTYVANSKHLLILPKGASYEWNCSRSGHYLLIDFDSDLAVNELFSLTINGIEPLENSLNALERVQLSSKNFSNIESIYLVYSLILNALKLDQEHNNYTPSAKKNRLRPAMDYLLSHFTSSIKNKELADLCGISEVYFRKLFLEVYGISPITYIQNLRISRAKEMLKSDYNSIADIAFSLGYNNIYEFSKAFKKHTGVSPSKY